METVLNVIGAELNEVTDFKDLDEKVKELLYDLEDTTEEDYE